jgi:hypothetical protein
MSPRACCAACRGQNPKRPATKTLNRSDLSRGQGRLRRHGGGGGAGGRGARAAAQQRAAGRARVENGSASGEMGLE